MKSHEVPRISIAVRPRPTVSVSVPKYDIIQEQPAFRATLKNRTLNEKTIYEVYTPLQKRWLLISCSFIGFLLPFTDTVYLPALANVQMDFNATIAQTVGTMSAYMGAVALGNNHMRYRS